jgi:cyclopropane fatty-acyl-phospholipid synthase-like methyltransferase
VPDLGTARFNVIVAMDVIEHIADWKGVLAVLVEHLQADGVLFANNGILDDDAHPEHYHIDNREFVAECVRLGLMPLSPITFHKRPASSAPARPQGHKETVHA